MKNKILMTRPCGHCKKTFTYKHGHRVRKFCSRRCYIEEVRLKRRKKDQEVTSKTLFNIAVSLISLVIIGGLLFMILGTLLSKQ